MRKGRIYTKDNTGQVRVYDGAAITPDEKYIGLEVKSGKSSEDEKLNGNLTTELVRVIQQ